MEEEFVKQALAEIIESTGQGMGLIASALARHGNAAQLAEDLRAVIFAAKNVDTPPMAIRLARHALAAVEAESGHQNPAKH